MAKASSKASILLNFALVLSLLLVVTVAEGKLFSFVVPPKPRVVSCDTVYGVQPDDICFTIAQKFDLTTEEFNGVNPNLDCTKLFVGQWLCVKGSAA